ncbi:hypothetical protein [Bradyrhizobium sp. C9]|uniref:hypothetical protein n=1 Tax=Bradyrhizobium sp. C9 TaxID=142585 RepID=UPI000BE9311D|nr:hypothetical protein [Bradyrhizobium sp. C9]PDT68506.1 hypothetical protein CO675_39170 [Bradyrhizobium sp. C9]
MPSFKRRSNKSLKGGKLRIPLAWFEPEDYSGILDILNFPDDMSRSYARWNELAKNREQDLKQRGFFAVRVTVRPDEFKKWCASKSMQPDGRALNLFVDERGTGFHY